MSEAQAGAKHQQQQADDDLVDLHDECVVWVDEKVVLKVVVNVWKRFSGSGNVIA